MEMRIDEMSNEAKFDPLFDLIKQMDAFVVECIRVYDVIFAVWNFLRVNCTMRLFNF